jgi:hypothetical protein
MKHEELDILIEKSFRTEPDFHLPVDFAQKVTLSVVRREQWKTDLGEYVSLTVFLLGLLSVVGGFYYYLDKELILQVFSIVSENITIVVCAVFILNFILFADKVLLGLLFSRWNSRLKRE